VGLQNRAATWAPFPIGGLILPPGIAQGGMFRIGLFRAPSARVEFSPGNFSLFSMKTLLAVAVLGASLIAQTTHAQAIFFIFKSTASVSAAMFVTRTISNPDTIIAKTLRGNDLVNLALKRTIYLYSPLYRSLYSPLTINCLSPFLFWSPFL
jgi:hypothetical protein